MAQGYSEEVAIRMIYNGGLQYIPQWILIFKKQWTKCLRMKNISQK